MGIDQFIQDMARDADIEVICANPKLHAILLNEVARRG